MLTLKVNHYIGLLCFVLYYLLYSVDFDSKALFVFIFCPTLLNINYIIKSAFAIVSLRPLKSA